MKSREWKYSRSQRRVFCSDSEAILSLYYDQESRTLEVQYLKTDGFLYLYQGVSKKVFIDCVQDVSVGGFINEVIKPHYAVVRTILL
jgi:hypothetical protein